MSDHIDCGHPNHGNENHDCAPFLPEASMQIPIEVLDAVKAINRTLAKATGGGHLIEIDASEIIPPSVSQKEKFMSQTRLNININKQTEAALRSYASDNDVTVTESVRRFIGVAESIITAMDSGYEVLLRKHDETQRIVFMY